MRGTSKFLVPMAQPFVAMALVPTNITVFVCLF